MNKTLCIPFELQPGRVPTLYSLYSANQFEWVFVAEQVHSEFERDPLSRIIRLSGAVRRSRGDAMQSRSCLISLLYLLWILKVFSKGNSYYIYNYIVVYDGWYLV